MTAWWERARSPGQVAVIENGDPRLIPGGRSRLIGDLRQRTLQFVPEWQPAGEQDAGDALVKLFGVQADPIMSRIERLDEKYVVEFLSIAGLSLAPARPATTLVAFTAATAAPAPVIVPQGFPLSSAAGDGSPDDVIWETERAVAVMPGELAEILVFDGEILRPIGEGEAFLPFGAEQKPGSYLLLGLDSKIAPAPTVSLGFVFTGAGEVPPPAAEGGEPASTQPQPIVRWEALFAGRFVPIEIIVDDSATLARTGAMELRVPRSFTPDRPAAAGAGKQRRWLRLLLLQGRRNGQREVQQVLLNVVPALAARSIRDELPVPGGASAPRTWRLAQAPVLPGSLVLEVDEGALTGDLEDEATSDGAADGFRRWREVETLVGQPAEARVFVLDPAAGTITFGNDVDGRAPPAGIRNIVARRYRVASGRGGAVEADSIGKLVRSLPHLKGVTNPLPASGGVDAEQLASVVQSGPALVKARGRAVSPGDMAIFAARTPQADVARAFALRGIDPSLPGARLPGVVGLFIVPNRRPNDPSAGPPIPDAGTLRAAAANLAHELGPLGARVIAAAPRYHLVRIEASLEIDPAADAGAIMRVLLDSLDAYLSPYVGGDSGTGWSIGRPIRYSRLIRRLLAASPSVRSVPYLAIVVDDVRMDACADAPLTPYGLPWPAGHELLPVPAEATP
jgi:predicted phage baseplate assembly protein